MKFATQSKTEQETLIKDHEALISKIARRYTSSPALKSDLIQEGRIALLDAASSFDPNRGTALSAYAWSFINIAMLRFLHAEIRQASKPGLNDLVESDLVAASPSPEALVEEAELIAKMFVSMQGLGVTEREVLQRYFFEGKGLAAVARELHISIGCTHYKLHDAMASMSKRLRWLECA